MAGAGNLPFDADHAAQPDIQPIGKHDQPGRNRLAAAERHLLPLGAGRNVGDLVADELGGGGNLSPERVDELIIHDAVLVDRRPVEQMAEAGDPVFARVSRT